MCSYLWSSTDSLIYGDPVTSTLCSSIKPEKQKKPSLLPQAHCTEVQCSVSAYICTFVFCKYLAGSSVILGSSHHLSAGVRKPVPVRMLTAWHGVSDAHCWVSLVTGRGLLKPNLCTSWGCEAASALSRVLDIMQHLDTKPQAGGNEHILVCKNLNAPYANTVCCRCLWDPIGVFCRESRSQHRDQFLISPCDKSVTCVVP